MGEHTAQPIAVLEQVTPQRKMEMAPSNKLSNREWQVAKLLLQGKSNKLIASSLGISERTVEFHLKNIYAKLQVHSRIELVLKLGNATGTSEREDPGDSTVDERRKSMENRDGPHFWMAWASSLQDHVSILRKELEMKNLWNLSNLLMLVAGLLLLVVNWLAFHDFHEVHTVRDWLMLLASALVFLHFARELRTRGFGQG